MRRTRCGGAVPSRWTWSSALGSIVTSRRGEALPDRGRVRRRGVADRERGAEGRARRVRLGVGARVDERERPVGGADVLAGRGDLGEPDGMVDVLGLVAPAA